MTHYSSRSVTRLRTAHPELQTLFSEVDARYPHTVLEAERTEEQQRENVDRGVSKTMDSKHLKRPAEAVDAAPDPMRWPQATANHKRLMSILSTHVAAQEKREVMKLLQEHVKEVARWYHFNGYILATADQLQRQGLMTRGIRQGCDWDGDKLFNDQSFDDLPHTELV